MNYSLFNRLAVCSWSLQPTNPEQLLQSLFEIPISKVQIALDPLREHPENWGALSNQAAKVGVEFVSGMFGCVGEDYSTMESIRRTGGVVPDRTWDDNWRNIQRTADIASRLGLRLVSFHAGFLPHGGDSKEALKLFQRMRQIADLFAAHQIDVALETGQETAETLREFLKRLDRKNVGVNFDPANMILYGKGDPIAALQILSPWLKQCHIKDARKSKKAGTWGEEVVAGTGEVNWRDFFQTLREKQFAGFCAIEREAGNQRIQDIRAARHFAETFSI